MKQTFSERHTILAPIITSILMVALVALGILGIVAALSVAGTILEGFLEAING